MFTKALTLPMGFLFDKNQTPARVSKEVNWKEKRERWRPEEVNEQREPLDIGTFRSGPLHKRCLPVRDVIK